MIKIGNTEISKIYLGSTEVPKAYLGTVEVYGTGPQPIDYSKEYFTLKALENGHFGWNVESMLYSLNGGAWTAWDNTNGLDVLQNDEVRFKDNAGRNGYTNRTILATGNFEVYGNSMSLFSVYGDNFSGATSFPSGNGAEFQSLFSGNTHLISAENLVLPATTLNTSSYHSTFRGCTSLEKAPQLPATTVGTQSYQATFYGCTSLTTAPDLLAPTLGVWSYYEMFRGAISLNYIKCLATDLSASLCTSSWVHNVSDTGTFVKSPNMSDWTTGTSGIPVGWTVVDAT